MVRYAKRRMSRIKRRSGRTYTKRRYNRMRKASSKPTLLKRTFCLETWTPSTVTTGDFWKYYQFTFGSLPSSAELSAIWDQVKINRIKVTFRPRYDSFNGNDTTDTTAPGVTAQGGTNLHVIVDPRSNMTPTGTYTRTTLNTFLENGSVRSYTGTKPFSFMFTPVVGTNLSGSASTFAQFYKAPYHDAALGNVTHRGFHIFAQDTNLTGVFNQSFDVFVTYYMSFRGTR